MEVKEWAEFQSQHGLSDSDNKLARQTGFPLKRFQSLMVVEGCETGTSKSQQIRDLHTERQENVAARQSAIEAGLIEPQKKKPVESMRHDPSQKWKAPVKIWIQELYEERIALRRKPSSG